MANETAFVIKCSAIGKLKLENVVQIHRNRVKSERTAALNINHATWYDMRALLLYSYSTVIFASYHHRRLIDITVPPPCFHSVVILKRKQSANVC